MPEPDVDPTRLPDPFSMNGRRVVVTGGISGIGAGVAGRLCCMGAEVVIVGRDAEKARAVMSGFAKIGEGEERQGGMGFIACDVSDPAAVSDMAARAGTQLGGIDGLVCSAGIGIYKPIADASVEEVRTIFDVNILGMIWCIRALLPELRENRGGVVGVSSVHSTQSAPSDDPYAATKGAIDGFLRACALSYAPEVRINCVRPGWIDTSLTQGIYEDLSPSDPDAAKAAIARAQPAQRIGVPDDVELACAFLLSSAASFVTGTTLTVDGGLSSILEQWSPQRVQAGFAFGG